MYKEAVYASIEKPRRALDIPVVDGFFSTL